MKKQETNQNIVLDFTSNLNSLTASQPLAVMPTELAKRALQSLVNSMQKVGFRTIKDDIIHDLAQTEDMDSLMNTMTSFLQERELINNVMAGNWDAYSTDKVEAQAQYSSL